jgi:predicted Zn-dependent protease
LDTRWRLAHLLAQDDARLQEAEKLVAGLDAGPNPPARILHLLGSLRARLGRVEEGQRLLAEHARRAATEASRENDHLRYNVLLERAVVVLGEGATAEADRLLAEIARLPPSVQDERLALLRAESMLVQGKRTAALQELSLVVAARPLLWRYRYLRAEVLAALGLQQEALTELEAVDRLQPFAVDARRLRLRLLPADSPARRREASRLEVLEALLTADEPLLADGQRAPAATARTQLLFDAVQLHPRARLPEPDVIPMD